MGRKPQVQARMPANEVEKIDEYCEEHDIARSDGVRQLIRKGLDEAEQEKVSVVRQEYAAEGFRIVLTAAAAFVGAGVSL